MNAKELKVERIKVLADIDKLLKKCECDTHGVRILDCENCKKLKKLGDKLTMLVGKRKGSEGEKPSNRKNRKWTESDKQKLREQSVNCTYEDLADIWDMPVDSMIGLCRRFRIKCKPTNNQPVYELYIGGKLTATGSVNNIAKETGIARGKVEYCRAKRKHEDMEMKQIG